MNDSRRRRDIVHVHSSYFTDIRSMLVICHLCSSKGKYLTVILLCGDERGSGGGKKRTKVVS